MSKEEQIASLKEERDRLIQISNDLRADLNRSQRLVNDLMSKEMHSGLNSVRQAGILKEREQQTPNAK